MQQRPALSSAGLSASYRLRAPEEVLLRQLWLPSRDRGKPDAHVPSAVATAPRLLPNGTSSIGSEADRKRAGCAAAGAAEGEQPMFNGALAPHEPNRFRTDIPVTSVTLSRAGRL